MKRELLIGCGNSRRKQLVIDGHNESFDHLTTIDIDPNCNPTCLWDLNNIPYPFKDNEFDEIHAYEVLEHIGQQGDYKTFFAQFSEFYRILKPNGLLLASCPSYKSVWAWGDPSHSRVIQSTHLNFLDQSVYTRDIGKTSMSDFRYIYKADFNPMWCEETDEHLRFVIQAIKPSRIT